MDEAGSESTAAPQADAVVTKAGFVEALLPASIQHDEDKTKTPALVTNGARVLLSENLFKGDDGSDMEVTQIRQALKSLLERPDSPIAIMSPRDMRNAAMNQNASRDKLSVVMTRDDFEDESVWNGSDKETSVRASMLVLNDKLTGKKYLCLEAIVGLANALMRNDEAAVRAYYGLLTGKALEDEVLGLLKDGRMNNVEFARAAILVFCDEIKEITDAEFERYRLLMEDCFIAA